MSDGARRSGPLEALVKCEAGLSAAFALVLARPEGLATFVRAIRDHEPEVEDTLGTIADALTRLLGAGARPRVETEVHLASAGNLDIVVWCPIENVVIAIETKVRTSLSANQLTKYRLALKAGDPSGRLLSDGTRRPPRAIVSVLLCVRASEVDRAKDPSGCEQACVVPFAGLSEGPWWPLLEQALGEARDPRLVLAEYASGVASTARRAAYPADRRGEVLRLLDDELRRRGWSGEAPSGVSADWRSPDGRSWKVRVGGGPEQHMSLVLPSEIPRTAQDGPPDRFAALCRGYKTVSLPEPYPTHMRPWAENEAVIRNRSDDLSDQAFVAAQTMIEVADYVPRNRA